MKNPTILEGGIARVFSGIRKLFTRQSGSDDMITWVPESDRQLTTKYITQNGVYRAADDGYYAYSSVTVSVPTDTGVTGEGEDGEQHYVAPDPETGELVDIVLADNIKIVTPPTFVGPYGDNAYIGIEGMVVKAYLASGELYTELENGIVPNNEITLVPNVTEYDPSRDTTGAIIVTSDLDLSPTPKPFYAAGSFTWHANWGTDGTQAIEFILSGTQKAAIFHAQNEPDYSYYAIIADTSSGSFTQKYYRNESPYSETTVALSRSYSYDSKAVHWYYQQLGYDNPTFTGIPVNGDAVADKLSVLAWTMCYGDATPAPEGAFQTITVEWPRTGDGAVLSDTFDVIVKNISSGGGED